MSTSDMVAVFLLVMAIGDTLAAKYILPGILEKMPDMTDKKAKTILFAVNAGTYIFAALAVLIYYTQLIG
ncbi:MAG: hypothetical protein ACN2B6_02105 [Rickettsiales bacterium]